MFESIAIIKALLVRHFIVWKTMFWGSLSSHVVNPSLFLFSFGQFQNNYPNGKVLSDDT